MESLGPRIRRLRTEQGLSLSELARLSGVSKGYLSQVERSPQARPSAATLFAVARALGTSVSDLFEGSDAVGGGESGSDLPPGLAEFAAEVDLPPVDVEMLAAIRYRGAAPRNKEDWRFIYESIRRSVRGDH